MTWKTVDESTVYPDVRYRAETPNREYRIYFDPEGKQVHLPDLDEAVGGEWWFLWGRETRKLPLDWYIVLNAHRTLDVAKWAANNYESSWPLET